MLLTGIPLGIVSVYDTTMATKVAFGFNAWLSAIPEPLYTLFGAGYLGHTGFRSWDKKNGVAG